MRNRSMDRAAAEGLWCTKSTMTRRTAHSLGCVIASVDLLARQALELPKRRIKLHPGRVCAQRIWLGSGRRLQPQSARLECRDWLGLPFG